MQTLEKTATITVVSDKPTTTLPTFNRPGVNNISLVWTEQDRSKKEGDTKVYEWYPFLDKITLERSIEMFGKGFVEELVVAKLKQLFQQHWFKSAEQEIDEFVKILESDNLSARKETYESLMRAATKLLKLGDKTSRDQAQELMKRALELSVAAFVATGEVKNTVTAKLMIK